jgi:hypothetical protein
MKLAPLLAAALLAGCSTASHTVSTAGKAASDSVSLAGKTAASATGAAIQVARSGASAAGQVARATAGAAIGVAQAPFIRFKDKASGRTQQIPWEKGMTVASAARLAKLAPPITAFQVVRGQEILKGNRQLSLQPGDIIERLASVAGSGSL